MILFAVSGYLPNEENCPPFRVEVWVKVSVSSRVLGLGWGATRQLPPRKIAPRLSIGFGLGLVLGLGGNFPLGQLS